jgi:SPX domain protein involved in polyphosphate accumulation/uncharacterized membrane protein YidH (DUF202 family)
MLPIAKPSALHPNGSAASSCERVRATVTTSEDLTSEESRRQRHPFPSTIKIMKGSKAEHSVERSSLGSFSAQSIKQETDQLGYLSSFTVARDALYGAIDKSKDRLANGHVDLSQAQVKTCVASEFLDLFEAELHRVTKTILSQLESQELSAKALLSNIEAVVNNMAMINSETTKSFRIRANELAEMCLKLQRFVATNASILTNVALVADSEIKASCIEFLKRRLSVSPWIEGPNSALVVVLSDIYEEIRKAEAHLITATSAATGNDDKWVAPSSFERSTTKYWIEEDKLTELLLAAVAETPLLVYGRSGRLTAKSDKNKTEGNKLWDSLAAPISSVYFDSPDMSLYRERIRRSEGAQLFRVRWYGSKPKGEELVFLELKTHHEKWINVKSVKERVNIQEQDMKTFLSPKDWTAQVAKSLVTRANPKLKGGKLDTQVELLQTMHELVIQKKLRPCIRSMYNRAALQSPKSNALRLTLDRNVTLIDETRAPEGSWCLSDDAVITDDMISRAPYPVFEVKLSDSAMPGVFLDLINSGTLIEAPKFSKFLSGAAAFNASKLDMLPYWAENPVFHEMFHIKSSCDRRNASEKQTVSPTTDTGIIQAQTCLPTKVFNADDEKDEDSATSTKYATSSDNKSDSASGLTSDDHHAAGFKESSISWLRNRQPLQMKRRSGKASPSTIDKARDLGNYNWIGFIRSKARGKNQTVAPRRPARVEPKSYFANERTFIQWVSAALLLVTISVILLDIHAGSVGTDGSSPIPMAAGIILNTVAIFVIVYAVFSYYRRLTLLQSAEAYGYVDHFAPVLLALASLLGITILLFYYVDIGRMPMGPTLVAQPGHCFQRPIDGASQLIYQPSGILVDNKRGMFLVPSVDRITGLSMSSPSTPVADLIVVPNADLEAITYVGERVFALGEGKKKPFLIELKWGTLNALQEVQRWELNTNSDFTGGRGEGLAYVPDGSGGSLYVAGDEYDPSMPQARGAVYIFDIPPTASHSKNSSYHNAATETPELKKRGQLNRNLLNSGLLDSKIGSLHYFEGVLYVLNDNSRVIRSWDVTTGELLATTLLPRVGVEFDKQWEGLAIGRNSDSPTSSLRGAPRAASSLTLHLALDTPPQVWSFTVSEAVNAQGQAMRGSLVFPACAVAV